MKILQSSYEYVLGQLQLELTELEERRSALLAAIEGLKVLVKQDREQAIINKEA